MSWNHAPNPHCPDADASGSIETLIVPRVRDLGGFEVRRVLPASRRQMVGPFIFFDQMGPTEFSEGQGIDVHPHPHIGLATVTYLYEGSLVHRDSLGVCQRISPGEVNWMVAGRGVTHSERTAPEVRAQARSVLAGIQTWVALPREAEGCEPSFEHLDAKCLPLIEDRGVQVRLILGELYGMCTPVSTFSPLFYADAKLKATARLPLTSEYEDRGIYVVEGTIELGARRFDAGQMLVLRPGEDITITSVGTSRLMLLGGEPLQGPRYIWWNFVASSKAMIEEAKRAWGQEDWENGQFALPPDDNKEFIPLPG
jgi:redox-sensitive bicupin YhaK (pirin superfamily)